MASNTITMKVEYEELAGAIGNLAIGVMIACNIALFYSLLVLKKLTNNPNMVVVEKNKYTNITESVIFGIMVALALFAGISLEVENPYWVPTSCMAVMQGISTKHIFTRATQRVLGTFIGLGLTWLILQMVMTVLGICICILILQIIIEFLLVRNYATGVIFITTLTILIAEPNISLLVSPDHLTTAWFFDIQVGSIIGAVGGWFLFNQRIHSYTKKHVRKSKVVMDQSQKLGLN